MYATTNPILTHKKMKTQRTVTATDIETNDAVRKDGLKVGDMAWFDGEPSIKSAVMFIADEALKYPVINNDYKILITAAAAIGAAEAYAAQFYTEAEVREIVDKALGFVYTGVQIQSADFIKDFDYSHLLTKNK